MLPICPVAQDEGGFAWRADLSTKTLRNQAAALSRGSKGAKPPRQGPRGEAPRDTLTGGWAGSTNADPVPKAVGLKRTDHVVISRSHHAATGRVLFGPVPTPVGKPSRSGIGTESGSNHTLAPRLSFTPGPGSYPGPRLHDSSPACGRRIKDDGGFACKANLRIGEFRGDPPL